MFGGLFGQKGYGDMYGTYANALQGIGKSYDPWSQGGLKDFQQASGLAYANAAHPSMALNRLASSFQTSPYQQNMLNQTRQQMAANAAQTGMLGSQAGNLQLAQQMNNMTGQFQNQYMNQGLGLMGQGLNTLAGLSPQGLNALNRSNSYQQMAAQAHLQGSLADQSARGNMFGDIAGLGMQLAPLLMKMYPPTAAAGAVAGAAGAL